MPRYSPRDRKTGVFISNPESMPSQIDESYEPSYPIDSDSQMIPTLGPTDTYMPSQTHMTEEIGTMRRTQSN